MTTLALLTLSLAIAVCVVAQDTIINVSSACPSTEEPVMFSVGSVSHFAPAVYSRVPMDKEYVNIGNHFNMATGIFTVPVTGLYSCFFGASSYGSLHVYIALHVGNPEVAVAASFDWNGHGTAAGSEIRLLKKGDTASMWARGKPEYQLYGHSVPTTRFSCHLLKQME